MAGVEELGDEVATDKPRGAGDEDFQAKGRAAARSAAMRGNAAFPLLVLSVPVRPRWPPPRRRPAPGPDPRDAGPPPRWPPTPPGPCPGGPRLALPPPR